MIEVSSFLSGKNLCNIFADLVVKKINEVTPDAKTQITVINVRNFFIVKGVTTSDSVINLSDILSGIYEKYDSELLNKVRVIDTILYNKEFDLNLNLNFSEDKKNKSLISNLYKTCNDLLNEGFYITVKLNNGVLFYDFEHEKDFDPLYIKEKFPTYTCIKDDFSQDVYASEEIYGLSNNGIKYYHFLIRKISYNLLSRGFSKITDISISSELKLNDVDAENIILKLNKKSITDNSFLESLILDNFNFDISKLEKEVIFNDFDVLKSISESSYLWENFTGTKDFILL
jgi:hypothetical protein